VIKFWQNWFKQEVQHYSSFTRHRIGCFLVMRFFSYIVVAHTFQCVCSHDTVAGEKSIRLSVTFGLVSKTRIRCFEKISESGGSSSLLNWHISVWNVHIKSLFYNWVYPIFSPISITSPTVIPIQNHKRIHIHCLWGTITKWNFRRCGKNWSVWTLLSAWNRIG
jgi:hypothetical protein